MQEGSIIGGRYQLVELIAEGGLSTVWQGVARSSEVFARPVAVKVMKRANQSASQQSPRGESERREADRSARPEAQRPAC